MSHVRQVIAQYADRLHATVEGQHVASPLGAWLVLALAADTAAQAGSETADLEEHLGCTVAEAAAWARSLLATPPRALSLALAAWADATDASAELLAALETWPCERGAVPSQDVANAWAKRSTRGLIEVFPVEIEPRTSLLLASALVSKIRWDDPFGWDDGEWQGVPLMRSAHGHRVQLWRSPVGLLASHEAAGEGLRVRSLIAVEDDVAPAQLLALLHDGRELSELTDGQVHALPLGPRGLLEVTEEEVWGDYEIAHPVELAAALPAWRLESRLTKASLPGLEPAGHRLGSLLKSWRRFGPGKVEAVQVATASFDRYGFEGAAVTSLAVLATGLPAGEDVLLRKVHVRFARPYAFVAEVDQPDLATWHGVPVFSGVVTEPRQPSRQG